MASKKGAPRRARMGALALVLALGACPAAALAEGGLALEVADGAQEVLVEEVPEDGSALQGAAEAAPADAEARPEGGRPAADGAEPAAAGAALTPQSNASNKVFVNAQTIPLNGSVTGTYDYDENGNWEEYYYKFQTSSRRARYKITVEALDGRDVRIYTSNSDDEGMRFFDGSTTLETRTKAYGYRDDLNYNSWYYICVYKYRYSGNMKRYDRYRLTVQELPDAQYFTVSGLGNRYWTGSEITQSPVVRFGSTTLRYNIDYELSYANNKDVGTATVYVTGIGAYSGTTPAYFSILRSPIASAQVSGIKNATYSGYAITPSPVVTLAGKELDSYYDYDVSYKNNVNVGTATVTITGKGVYGGTVKRTFKIQKAANPISVYSYNYWVRSSYVKKAARKVQPLSIYGAVGKVTCKNVSTTKKAKKFKVANNGKVTIPRGTKKGTYKIKVRVTAKGNKNYKAKTVTRTVKITVR